MVAARRSSLAVWASCWTWYQHRCAKVRAVVGSLPASESGMAGVTSGASSLIQDAWDEAGAVVGTSRALAPLWAMIDAWTL
jgi:hypothetical protein